MTETVLYAVLKKIDAVELRRYPQVIFAVTDNDEYDSGFNRLFQYITGANKTKKSIAMTAPVVTSEKIAMTAPVVTHGDYMAFALPASYTKDTVPIPTNPAVRIEIQPERTMAAIRFSGHTPNLKIQKQTQTLHTSLQQHKISVKGEPVLMRYNSPFTPGFLRRNEVAVEVADVQ
jgi:hypothetical protein